MKNNLKNRYIYAVTRLLPKKMQADVEKELDSLISEMESEQDIKSIIEQLGTPEELALKYSNSEQKALISGIYFLLYKRVLTIVLPIVVSIFTVFATINSLLSYGHLNWLRHITDVLAGAAGGAVQAFATITIIFAILDYKKVNLVEQGIIDGLPHLPTSKKKISIDGPIFGITFSLVTTALLLLFPQILGFYIDYERITIFNIYVLRSLWLPIIIWTVLEISFEIFALIEGRHSKRLAMFSLATCVASLACGIIIFGSANIFSPEFLALIEYWSTYASDNPINNFIFVNPNFTILIPYFIIIAIETIYTVYHGFKATAKNT